MQSEMVESKRCRYYWLVPLLVLLIGTAAIVWSGADIAVESFFFRKGVEHWPVGQMALFDFAYHFGEYIGLLPAIAGCVILVASLRIHRLVQWRRASIFLLLVLVIGPGILVNATLKEHWHRPRPRQIEQFGGDYAFQHPLVMGDDFGSCKSFPSGHASMGFIFLSPYFIFLVHNRRKALLWLYGGLAYGLFVGAARMAQGAHWPSDILWAFGVVYFTCYALARILRLDRMESNDQSA